MKPDEINEVNADGMDHRLLGVAGHATGRMPMADPSTFRDPDLLARRMKGSDIEEYSPRTLQVFDMGFHAHFALFFGLRPPGRGVPLAPTPGVSQVLDQQG